MFYFDRTIILLIPAIIVSAIAQFKISSAYNKYSKVTNQRGITGEQAAINILKANGIYDVEVEMVNGRMTDHYDPRAKKLRLSQEVYFGTSIAAVGIASHEVGHAIQHNVSYTPLILRNAIVPAVNFGAGFSWILFLLGLIMGIKPLLTIGIV
ncbi:Putative zinc-dependent metalloprotease, partial [Candidatus Arthromitus sp. SFB-4]